MLTDEQIEKEATTPQKALELSIKHWWENYKLTKAKLKSLGETVVASCRCGLCVFYEHPYDEFTGCAKSGCKVRPTCTTNGSLYKKAENAVADFVVNPTEENYQSWRKDARAMHKYLCSLR